MPRKGRERAAQSPREKAKKTTPGAEAMPQVWLPDQPDVEGGDGLPLFLPPADQRGPPPTDEEQRQVAQFWELEEHQTPRGWDEDQELDYSEVVRKREERELSETRESETPELFKYAQSSTYCVRSLGHLDHLSDHTGSQTNILASIDKAQKQGRLPWVTSDSDQRVFCISKYGIKVMDPRKQRVFCRLPLHHIVNITYYEDTYSNHMLAVRVVTSGDTRQQQLHIYQAQDEAQAKDVCLTLAQTFETVHSNLQLQQNLTSDLR